MGRGFRKVAGRLARTPRPNVDFVGRHPDAGRLTTLSIAARRTSRTKPEEPSVFKNHPAPHRRMKTSWPVAAAIAPPVVLPPAACDDARTIALLQGHLRAMTAEVAAAETRERERIACRLHDELGQHIVLVRLKLGELRAADTDAMTALIDELATLVARTAEAARAVTFELGRPAWQGGLFGALEALGSNLARQAGLEVRVDAPPSALRLADAQLGLVCRVVRELCLNVHKHARARRVVIASSLEGDCLRVNVIDDGEGLGRPVPPRWQAERSGGFGLASAQAQLRACGGDLEMRSAPGRGTAACLVLPLVATEAIASGRTS